MFSSDNLIVSIVLLIFLHGGLGVSEFLSGQVNFGYTCPDKNTPDIIIKEILSFE